MDEEDELTAWGTGTRAEMSGRHLIHGPRRVTLQVPDTGLAMQFPAAKVGQGFPLQQYARALRRSGDNALASAIDSSPASTDSRSVGGLGAHSASGSQGASPTPAAARTVDVFVRARTCPCTHASKSRQVQVRVEATTLTRSAGMPKSDAMLRIR